MSDLIIKREFTEELIEQFVDTTPDGRGIVNCDIPELNVPCGKIYGSRGNGIYWIKKKAGLIGEAAHNSRGKDKKPRRPHGKASLADRYFRMTGKNITYEMEAEAQQVEMMAETAAQISDPVARFKALEAATKARNAFSRAWAPYMERKLGTLKSEQSAEQHLGLDDLLNSKLIENGKIVDE